MASGADDDVYTMALEYADGVNLDTLVKKIKVDSKLGERELSVDEHFAKERKVVLGVVGLRAVYLTWQLLGKLRSVMLWVQRVGVGHVYVDMKVLMTWSGSARLVYDCNIDGMIRREYVMHCEMRGGFGWWVCFLFSHQYADEITVFVTGDPYRYYAKYGFTELREGSQTARTIKGDMGFSMAMVRLHKVATGRWKVALNERREIIVCDNMAEAGRQGYGRLCDKWLVYGGGGKEDGALKAGEVSLANNEGLTLKLISVKPK